MSYLCPKKIMSYSLPSDHWRQWNKKQFHHACFPVDKQLCVNVLFFDAMLPNFSNLRSFLLIVCLGRRTPCRNRLSRGSQNKILCFRRTSSPWKAGDEKTRYSVSGCWAQIRECSCYSRYETQPYIHINLIAVSIGLCLTRQHCFLHEAFLSLWTKRQIQQPDKYNCSCRPNDELGK